MAIRDLISRRAVLVERERALIDQAERSGFTDEHRRDLDRIDAELRTLQGDLDRELRAEGRAEAARPKRDIPYSDTLSRGGDSPHKTNAGEVAMIGSRQRFSEFRDYSDLPSGMSPHDLSVGRLVKAMVTGNWSGAEAERELVQKRAQGGSLSVAGGYLLPQVLADQVIDLARSKARVIEAGANVFEMTARDVTLARVDGDPTGSWVSENATIPNSTMTFGALNLSAKKLATLVKTSIELVRDAPNASATIENALAAQLGITFDAAALRGNGAGQPLGIRYTSGVNLSTATTSTAWTDVGNAIRDVRAANGEPNALVWAPRTEATFGLFVDGNARPFAPPPYVDELAKYRTTAVPITSAGGASTAYGSTQSTEIYVGDFSQLLFGIRSGVEIEVSNAAGDSNGGAFSNYQLWIRAVMRGDVGLAHEDHFSVIVGSTA